MFSNLFSSISDSIYLILDDLTFIDVDIIDNIDNIMGTSFNTGINLICNSLVYGFLLYYAFSYLLSHLTFSQIERPSHFIFKLLLCSIFLNNSRFICSNIISIFYNISNSIAELGSQLLGHTISFSTLVKKINYINIFSSGEFNIFSFDGLLKGLSTVGFVSLTISYSIRYIMIKTLVIISPFAFLTLCNSKTSSFFKSWLRCFISALFLQILVVIILLVCFTISSNGQPLFVQIMHIGMIYSLIKANSFVKDLIGGFSTDISMNSSSLTSIFKIKE